MAAWQQCCPASLLNVLRMRLSSGSQKPVRHLLNAAHNLVEVTRGLPQVISVSWVTKGNPKYM